MTPPAMLLSSDLDRTLIPNDRHLESPQARPRFNTLCQSNEILLVYVSGRSQELIRQAIVTYDLPQPDFAITDVGASMFKCQDLQWQPIVEWSKTHQAFGWASQTYQRLRHFDQIEGLHLQRIENQTAYKVSFFWDLNNQRHVLEEHILRDLNTLRINANLIWSEDPLSKQGLLDILPPSADKHKALQFLGNFLKISEDRMFFAGDSGNDLAVLTSGIPSVLVANATSELKQEAVEQAKRNQTETRLYLASGTFEDTNGNYAAGVLEGFYHFFPQLYKECML